MEKFKVLKEFRNAETKEVYEVGAVIELPVSRALSITGKIGSSYLEHIEEEPKAEIKPVSKPTARRTAKPKVEEKAEVQVDDTKPKRSPRAKK